MRIERNSSRGLKWLFLKLPATPGQLSWVHCKAKSGCKELLALKIIGIQASYPGLYPLALWISSIIALSSYFPGVNNIELYFAPVEPILESLENFPRLKHLELIDPINAGPLHTRIAAERLTLTSLQLTVRYKRWQLHQSLVFSPIAIHDLNLVLMAQHCSWKMSALISTTLCATHFKSVAGI